MPRSQVSDRLGARRAFAIGLGLFTAASLVCGLAISPGMLIAARFAQGLGAAVQLPASLAMIRHAYPDGAVRTRAVGVWASAGGGAVAAGPVIGGLLLVWLGWRSLFLVNLAVGVIGLLATLRAEGTQVGRARRVDAPGQALVIAALTGLVFALIEGGSLGWRSPWVVAAFAAVAGTAFVWWEGRAPEPLLPLWMFRYAAFPPRAWPGSCRTSPTTASCSC